MGSLLTGCGPQFLHLHKERFAWEGGPFAMIVTAAAGNIQKMWVLSSEL